MKEVFISYESSNQKEADNLVAALEDKGHYCWIATRNVPKGDPYDDHIPKAIAECSLVVMLFSEASLNSLHVKKELRIAIKHGKKVIPFMLEDVELREAFEYHIESNNRISADRNWNKAVDALLNSIKLEFAEMERRIERIESKKHVKKAVHSEYICCPECKGTILKRKSSFTNRYANQIDAKSFEEKAKLWVAKNGLLINRIMVILILVLLMIGIFAFGDFSNVEETGVITEDDILQFLLYLTVLLFLFAIVAVIFDVPNVQNEMLQAVKNSKLDYVTLKCAKCEKEFGVLIPKEVPLEDRVEVLLSDNQENYK